MLAPYPKQGKDGKGMERKRETQYSDLLSKKGNPLNETVEFVKKIIVHAPDKSSGHRRKKVQIVWNFIGEVNLPNDSQVIERQRKSRTA